MNPLHIIELVPRSIIKSLCISTTSHVRQAKMREMSVMVHRFMLIFKVVFHEVLRENFRSLRSNQSSCKETLKAKYDTSQENLRIQVRNFELEVNHFNLNLIISI